MSNWKVFNKTGETRVLVTKMLPGVEWLNILIDANYKIEVNLSNEVTTKPEIIEKIGTNCRAIIGQLTENWDEELFQIFSSAGGVVYSNYAVGYNNVNVKAATKSEIAIGNTPGVLTEATSEMAVALTMACARRIVEADSFMRKGYFKGWLPNLFLGKRLYRGTVGIIGAGRIGFSYALTMVQAFQMNLIYFSNRENLILEDTIDDYNRFLQKTNSNSVFVKRAMTIEELLQESDVISLHVPLNEDTHHLIDKNCFSKLKKDAILINTSRGPIIDEKSLTKQCKNNPKFMAGLDVFENEPFMYKGLVDLDNVVVAPHIASATKWTREGMAKLAALNIKGVLENYEFSKSNHISSFLSQNPPKAIPNIVNSEVLNSK
jgi:hydroxypyruvate reductase 1